MRRENSVSEYSRESRRDFSSVSEASGRLWEACSRPAGMGTGLRGRDRLRERDRPRGRSRRREQTGLDRGTLAALPQDAETDRLLVKEQPAEGSRTRKENFVYMQESEGVSVMVSNVYHNGYTLYMTVTLRGEEPFAGQPRL